MRAIATFVVAVIFSSFYPNLPVNAQDRTRPPIPGDGKGPAKSATLIRTANLKEESKKPSDPLKGLDWVETSPIKIDPDTSNPAALNSLNGRFSLKLTESPENEGDVAAYSVTLTWRTENKPQVSLGISTGAVISPDSRYIMLEPLKLIDVEAWKIYDLRKALQIKEGYFTADRWAKDGKKFVVHVVQCPYDCPPGETIEYWLIELR